ncbi:hypothetical protein DOTSEDRAFT_131702 [Dothistroma septosporum NZE10]|uniref:NAD(P)-binding protein n=1 Tax=Dothistroma septosporum (strain NZE10 / CBS 128990) TaxID=675120 RepID=M2YMM2_DOTSN|nr:hypothetical protein DOTSEDRAFT_131702 [Dothistroma septosporum NZE10]
MTTSKRSVLITGCSDGGMGAALASEFHRVGLHVYATVRNISKMEPLERAGIETLELDIASEDSINACVKTIRQLDILVNNAGAQYTMPISDLDLAKAKKLFDSNLWGHIAMTQACLPLLTKSPKAIVVNHTSVGAGQAIPFQAAYNASKAALAMFTDTLRMELQPFDIAVVELRTGGVKTNVIKNVQAQPPKLPEGSLYSPARKALEEKLTMKWAEDIGVPVDQWAKNVVVDLLQENPPRQIWRGEKAWLSWFVSCLPATIFDNMIKGTAGLAKVEQILRKH